MSATTLLIIFCLFQQPSGEAHFDIRRHDLFLEPAEQTLILQGNQRDLVFNLRYHGSVDSSMLLRASLVGPGLSAPVDISAPATALRLIVSRDYLTAEGDYRLVNVRLEQSGQVIEFASPRQAVVHVYDEILVTDVDVRELSKEELARLGYIFNENDYRTVEFELAMVMGAYERKVEARVAFPRDQRKAFRPVVIDDPFQGEIQLLPMPSVRNGDFEGHHERTGPAAPVRYSVYSLLLIPGEISYLKTHFNVSAIVMNAAPEGLHAQVTNLEATLQLPDPTVYGAPLSLAEAPSKDVVFPGEDGVVGTVDDRNSLEPGQRGRADYILTGEIDGIHTIHAMINGELDVGGQTVTLTSVGKARILVRTPEYTVTMSHPDTVAIDEPYTLTAQITNVSSVPLEDLTLSIDPAALVGTSLEDLNPMKVLGTIQPGGTTETSWELRSLVTGEVVSSYFRVGDGQAATLNFTVGVGENGERLSPWAIVYPSELDTIFAQPATLADELRRYSKKIHDFALMSDEELPASLRKPSMNVVRHYFEQFSRAVRASIFGLSSEEAHLALVSSWLYALGNEDIDAMRRKIASDGNILLESSMGTALATSTSSLSSADVVRRLAEENERVPDLTLAVIESANPVGITLRDRNGRLTTNAGLRNIPFAATLPLSPNRWLVWIAKNEVMPRMTLTGSSMTVSLATRGEDGMLGFFNQPFAPESSVILSFDFENEQLLADEGGSFPDIIPGIALESKPLTLVSVKQLDFKTQRGADRWGRHVLLCFNKPVDLESMLPIEEHLWINGKPAVDARSQLDGRFVMITARMPIGPYADVTYRLSGVKDDQGADLGVLEGLVETSTRFTGVRATGKVVDHAGKDLSGAKVFLYQSWFESSKARDEILNSRNMALGSAGYWIFDEVIPDENGEFHFDYIAMPAFQRTIDNLSQQSGLSRTFKIGVLLEDGRYEEREFFPRGVSEEVHAEFAFSYLGEIRGQVTDENGQGLPFTPVWIANQRVMTNTALVHTDANGYYRVEDIEVGPILVKSRLNEDVGVISSYLTAQNSPLTIDLRIDSPAGVLKGKVEYQTTDGAFHPVEGAFVGVLLTEGFGTVTSEDSHGLPFTVATKTAEDGTYILENIPVGQAQVIFYHPEFSQHYHPLEIIEGDNGEQNYTWFADDFEGGSVSGIVQDANDQPIAGARVILNSEVVYSDATGAFTFTSVPLYRNHLVFAEEGNREGSIRVYLDQPGQALTGQIITLYNPTGISGFFTNANGEPMANYPIFLSLEGEENPDGACNPFAITDADGFFIDYTHVDRLTKLTVTSLNPPHISVFETGALTIGGVNHVLLQERPTHDVTINLKDAYGHPVVGIVTITSEVPITGCEDIGQPMLFERRMVTDALGTVTFTDFNEGPFTVVAEHLLLGSVALPEETLTGDVNRDISFPVEQLGALFGQIYDSDGVSQAPSTTKVYAKVGLGLSSGPESFNALDTQLDAEGYYQFSALVETNDPHSVDLVFFDPVSMKWSEDKLQLHQSINFRHDSILKNTGSVTVQVVDAEGTPVEYAAVQIRYRNMRLINGASGEIPEIFIEEIPDQITPSNPTITYTDVPSGPIFIEALGVNGLSGHRAYAVPVDGGDIEVTVMLEAPSSISGTFVDLTDVPITDAEVQLQDNRQQLLHQILSGALPGEEGTFSFSQLPMGRYHLLGKDPATNLTARAQVETSPIEPDIVDFILKLDPIVDVSGVVYANGEPVAGAVVEIDSFETGEVIITGTNQLGEYHFYKMPVGDYSIRATKKGLRDAGWRTVTLEENIDPAVIDLDFRRTHDLTVQVLGPDQLPVPRVMVRISSYLVRTYAFADDEGKVTIKGIPTGRLHIRAENQRNQELTTAPLWLTEADGDSVHRTLSMPGWGVISGQVLNSLGKPITKSVPLTFSWRAPANIYLPEVTKARTVYTDVNGHYRLGNMPVDEEFRISAYEPTTFEYAHTNAKLSEHLETLQRNLDFRAFTYATGQVIYADGTPAGKAIVSISDPVDRIVFADASGHFTIKPIPEGDIEITANDFTSPRTVTQVLNVQANVLGELTPFDTLTLQLGGLGAVTGVVTYHDGSPMRTGYVTLFKGIDREHVQTTGINSDGSYAFRNIPLNSYTVVAHDTRYLRGTEDLQLALTADGEEAILDLAFGPSFAVGGNLTDANGATVVNGVVELWGKIDDRFTRIYSDDSDSSGNYTLTQVYPGNYRLIAYNDDLSATYREEDFQVVAADMPETDVTLAWAANALGTVADANGLPFPSGTVSITQDGLETVLPLDPDGSFHFSGLLADAYTLTATVGDGWIVHQQSGVLSPGGNPITVTTPATVAVTGLANYLEPDYYRLGFRAYAYNASGIERKLIRAEDGRFYLNQVPANQDFEIRLTYGSLHQIFPISGLLADTDIGSFTLDFTPPEITFADENQTVFTTWNALIGLSDPDSEIDPTKTRIWFNDLEVTDLFTHSASQSSALFATFPEEIERGVNTLRVRAFNLSNAYEERSFDFTADQDGTHLIVTLRDFGEVKPGEAWLLGGSPIPSGVEDTVFIPNVQPGDHVLKGRIGTRGHREVITVTSDDFTQPFTLFVREVGSYMGRVVESDGITPVAGVRVDRYRHNANEGDHEITDANGAFLFDFMDLNIKTAFQVNHNGLSAIASPAKLIVANQTILTGDLVLQGQGVVEGFVYRDDGVTPVAGVNVDLHYEASGYAILSAVTDTQGFYRFNDVWTIPFDIRARDTGLNLSGSTEGHIGSPGATLHLDVILDPAYTLTGVLVDTNGQFAVGQTVTLGNASWYTEAITDASGVFYFSGIPHSTLVFEALNEQTGEFYIRSRSFSGSRDVDFGSCHMIVNQVPFASMTFDNVWDPDFPLSYHLSARDDLGLAGYVALELSGAINQNINFGPYDGRTTLGQLGNLTLDDPNPPDGMVNWTLTAADRFGLQTQVTGSFEVKHDAEGPLITVTSPAEGTTFAEGDPLLISLEADDPNGVDRIELYYRNQLVSTDDAAPYSFELFAPGVDAAGDVSFELRGYDGLGFVSSYPHTIHVLPINATTTAPSVTMISPLDGMPQPISLADGLHLELHAEFNDPDGLHHAEWRINGESVHSNFLFGQTAKDRHNLIIPAAWRANPSLQIDLIVSDLGGMQTQTTTTIHNIDGLVWDAAAPLNLAEWDTAIDGETIILVGGEHVIDGSHHFSDLLLVNGAQLSQTRTSSDQSWIANTDITATGHIVINPGSQVDMDAKGVGGTFHIFTGSHQDSYASLQRGAGQEHLQYVYGSPVKPELPGQWNGGGRVALTANAIWHLGLITARPNVHTGFYDGRGTGGAITLHGFSAVNGYGEISADGYQGDVTRNYTGQGGGGRIAIYGDFQGYVHTYGSRSAGAGTIYRRIPDSAQSDGFLDVIQVINAPEDDTWGNLTPIHALRDLIVGTDVHIVTDAHDGQSVDALSFTDPSILRYQAYAGFRIHKDGEYANGVEVVAQTADRILATTGASLNFNPGDIIHVDFAFDRFEASQGGVIHQEGHPIEETIVLHNGGLSSNEVWNLGDLDVSWTEYGAFWGSFALGDLVVNSNAPVYLAGSPTAGNVHIVSGTSLLDGHLQAESLRVDSDASFNTPEIEGVRFAVTASDITIDGAVRSINAGLNDLTGYTGTHGGLSSPDATPYGSLYYPTESGNRANDGGGRIHLVFDHLTHNGDLDASGNTNGSGGSILLEGNAASSMSGSGTIDVSALHKAKGGGRIAVLVDDLSGFSGSTRAYGSTYFGQGGAGTIFHRDNLHPLGKLVIDNAGNASRFAKNTVLPGLGQFTITEVTGGGSVITGSGFADDLKGLHVEIPGYDPIPIKSNTDSAIVAEDGFTFPTLNPGDIISGSHRFDVLQVTGAADFYSPDPIYADAVNISLDATINDTQVINSTQVRVIDNDGSISDPNVTDLTITNGAVVSVDTALTNLTRIQIDAGSHMILNQPVQVQDVEIHGTLESGLAGHSLTADNLTLRAGAVWTVKDLESASDQHILKAHIEGLLTVEAGALITVAGTGKTNGSTVVWPVQYAGKCNGGFGEIPSEGDPDMGGSFADPKHYFPHGGVIHISAGQLQLDGTIQADSIYGNGGGIRIDANVIAGSGAITSRSDRFNAGGGRIAIYYDSDRSFLDTLDIDLTYTGIFSTNDFEDVTGAGTLYLKSNVQAYGELIIDQKSDQHPTPVLIRERQRLTGITGPASILMAIDDDSLDPTVINDPTRVDLPPGLAGLTARFTVAGQEYNLRVLDNTHSGFIVEAGGPDVVPAGTVIEFVLKLDRLTLRNGAQVHFSGDIEAAETVFEGPYLNSIWAQNWLPNTAPFVVDNHSLRLTLEQPEGWENLDVSITNGELLFDKPMNLRDLNLVDATLSHSKTHRYWTNYDAVLNLTARHVTLDATSKIDVRSLSSLRLSSGSQNHGGIDIAGSVHGSLFHPGTHGTASIHSAGGVIQIQAETITGGSYLASGSSGTGGSIALYANTLNGMIQLDADGGETNGSGGRIAIYADNNQATITRSAWTPSPISSGGPGSIFVKTNGQSFGDLIIDNKPGEPCFLPLPAFPVQTLSSGFTATYDAGSNRTTIVIPGFDLTYNDNNRPLVHNYRDYWMVINGNPANAHRIHASTDSNGTAIFSVEGDLSGLITGDQLHPGLAFDNLIATNGCSLIRDNFILLDAVNPVVESTDVFSPYGPNVFSNEPFSLTVSASDNLQMDRVEIDWFGQIHTVTSQPYVFNLTAPLAGTYAITVTAFDHAGNSSALVYDLTVIDPPTPLYNAELLANPGFETAIDGSNWFMRAGNWAVSTEPAYSGTSSLAITDGYDGEIYQEVDVLRYRSHIDGGNLAFFFTGWHTDNGGSNVGSVIVEYLDASKQILSSWDSGQLANPSAWAQFRDSALAPAGTRFMRYRVLVDNSSFDNDKNRFDDLSLSASNPLIGDHEIALGNLQAPSSTDIQNPVIITATVENQGRNPASFNVTLSDLTDALSHQTQSVTALGIGQTAVLNFTYHNATGSLGVHNFTLVADTLIGETITADNSIAFNIDLQDIDPPVINSVRVTPFFEGKLDAGQTFTVSLDVTEAHPLQAQAGFDGLTATETGDSPYIFNFTAPEVTTQETRSLDITVSDAAGNQTTYNQILTILPADTTAPVVTVLSPADGAMLTPGSLLEAQIQATDARGITEIRATFQGQTQSQTFAGGDVAGEKTVTMSWTVPESGDLTLSVEADDASGNIGTDSVTYMLDAAVITPVAYWTFDSGEISTQKPYDLWGHHHGYASDANHGYGGQRGQAYRYNLDYTELPSSPALQVSNGFSAVFWYRSLHATSTSYNGGIITHGNTAQNAWSIRQVNGGGVSFSDGIDTITATGLTTSWHHVAITYEAGTATIYIDGLESASGQFAAANLVSIIDPVLMFGKDPVDGTYGRFYIDEVLLFDRSLSATIVENLRQDWLNDTLPDYRTPDEVTDIRVDSSSETSLDISWQASANADGDLAQYRILLDGLEHSVIPAGTNQIVITNLLPESLLELTIQSMDTSGNSSIGTKSIVATGSPNGFPTPYNYYTFDSADLQSGSLLDVIGRNPSNQDNANKGYSANYNQAFRFTNTRFIDLPGDTPFGQPQWTLSTWLKPSSFGNTPVLSIGDAATEVLGISFQQSTAKGVRIESDQGSGSSIELGYQLASTGTIVYEWSLNTWRHLVVTFDNGTVKAYLDGREQGSAHWPVSNLALQGWLKLGQRPAIGGNPNYYIDETAILDQALNARQVAYLHQHYLTTPLDLRPAAEITDLNAAADSSSLSLTWTGSADGDLTGYRVYVDDVLHVSPAAGDTSTTLTGLQPATRYEVRVTTVDTSDNESLGLTAPLATTAVDGVFPTPYNHYSFDNADHTAGKIHDLIGRNSSNQASASTGYTTVVEKGFRFTNSQYVDLPDLTPFASTNWSLSIWIRPSAFVNRPILSFGDSSVENLGISMEDDGGQGIVAQSDQAPNQHVYAGFNVAANGLPDQEMNTTDWRHFVLTFDHGAVTTWLDGIQQDNDTWPVTNLSLQGFLKLAQRPAVDGSPNFYVDHMSFFDQTLTPADIALLHQSVRNQTPVDLVPPEEATNLLATPTSDSLSLTWADSQSSDLAGYNVYLNGVLTASPTTNSTTLTGLNAGTLYLVRITAKDHNQNESLGLVEPVATLPNALADPIAYWTFDSADMNSSQIYDQIGANHGTMTGGSTNTNAVVNQSRYFSSSSHKIAVPGSSGLDMTGNLTVAGWFYDNNTNPVDGAGILTYGTDTTETWAIVTHTDLGATSISFQTNSPVDRRRVDSAVETMANGLSSGVSTRVWRHVAISFNQGEAKLYLDGVLQETATWDLNALPIEVGSELIFGIHHPGTDVPFRGYLDEFAIWDQTLNATEINVIRMRGKRGESLWQAPTKQRVFASSESFEDANNIVFSGEHVSLRDFYTEKTVWFHGSRVEIEGKIEARHIYVLDGSVITQGEGGRASQAAILKAEFFELDSTSGINLDGKGFAASGLELEAEQSQRHRNKSAIKQNHGGHLGILAGEMQLDGEILLRGLGSSRGGALHIEARLLHGHPHIDVSGAMGGGQVVLAVNNPDEFQGSIVTDLLGEAGTVIFEHAGNGVVRTLTGFPDGHSPEALSAPVRPDQDGDKTQRPQTTPRKPHN